MRVMYVASNPEEARTLQIEHEVNDLQSQLSQTKDADPIQFRFYTHIDFNEMTENIRSFEPDVLHFAAHGDNDRLILAHKTRGHIEIERSRLASLLGVLAVKPKLIVVNACSSSGIAEALAAAKAAKFVVGTDAPITNAGAREVVVALYRRLAGGASVGDAFRDAQIHLDIVEEVCLTLYPKDSLEEARRLRLTNPLRILAYFPDVDKWLKKGLDSPGKHFNYSYPSVGFGIAGAPGATRQVVFFTDDETVQPTKTESIEEVRCWVLETQPVSSKIWIDDCYEYYGDMNWFVAVTTTDGRIVSGCSTMCDALRRYYFDEQMRGPIPRPISEVILRSIESLYEHRGEFP